MTWWRIFVGLLVFGAGAGVTRLANAAHSAPALEFESAWISRPDGWTDDLRAVMVRVGNEETVAEPLGEGQGKLFWHGLVNGTPMTVVFEVSPSGR